MLMWTFRSQWERHLCVLKNNIYFLSVCHKHVLPQHTYHTILIFSLTTFRSLILQSTFFSVRGYVWFVRTTQKDISGHTCDYCKLSESVSVTQSGHCELELPLRVSHDFEIHLKTFIFRKSFNVLCIRDSQYSMNTRLKQCRCSTRSSHWITAMVGRMPWQACLQENEGVLSTGHPVHLLLSIGVVSRGDPVFSSATWPGCGFQSGIILRRLSGDVRKSTSSL